MSRWFRHYAGMMRDEKLVAAAIRSKQPVHLVVWVWGAILESAAERDEDGLFELDAGEAAYFLRTDEADIRAVLDALANAGRLAEGRVVKWGDRQYQSDKSAERQARYRERRRPTQRDGDDKQTSRDGAVTAQEAETEAETKVEDQPQVSAITRGRADLDRLEIELRKAAGLESAASPGLLSLAPVIGLLDGGHDLQLDVLPTIRAVAKRMKRPAASWDYFTEPIKEASAKRRGLAAGGLSPPIAAAGGNVFERLQRGVSDGPVRDSRGDGPIIDAVRSVPLIERQSQRDDGEGLPNGDRGVHDSRAA
jgi:hypothetical protein